MSISKKEKISAAFLLSSYLETLGFNNKKWEFNYGIRLDNINTVNRIILTKIQDFLLSGGMDIDITKWDASDDTIMIIATARALINKNNYKEEYIKVLPLLEKDKRASGNALLSSLKIMKYRKELNEIDKNSNMGGNGAAMRTGPIGIKYWNDEEKIIEESIISSKITHNYYIGFLGGVVSALFSSYALQDIDPKLWIDKLLLLYNNKIIHKYHSNEKEIDDFMTYWKRYKEVRSNSIKSKEFDNRLDLLMSFNPSKNIQKYVHSNESLLNKKDVVWEHLGITGIDSCIYAYDCILLSLNNSLAFTMNSIFHCGDSDTTACIGGFWYGLLYGFTGYNIDKMKELEFYKELSDLSNKFINF